MLRLSIIRKWAEVEWNGERVDAEVVFSVTPFIPATYWQPAEGGEVEIQRVLIDDGRDDIQSRLSGDVIEALAKSMGEAITDDDFNHGPDPDDERDRRIDDRLTMGEQ
ncbi:MAG TPA: hypothetical protein PKD99_12410 [Sphingopyxis sp.]|nr:hypothetical protein [Sphingopyxis sp.]HMP45901.1 hypothetical protein [Sphingopyxis sp.]